MLVRQGHRLLILALAVTGALAATAASAIANPPDQHKAQLLPASALGTFNVEAKMLAGVSAKCENGKAAIYPCKNVDLASFVPLGFLGGASGNDVWGWTDPENGDEYAIMGTSTSTAFVRVTDPKNPVLVGVLPTRGTPDLVLWRDIKVYKDHAFIVSEISRSGLQVFDLTRLRGRMAPTEFTADATYDGFSGAHNISINTESGTAYAVGVGDAIENRTFVRRADDPASEDCRNGTRADGGENGGLHMIDIKDPKNPTFLGCALVNDLNDGDDIESNNYSHDVECVNYDGPDADYAGREICFGSNENAVVIYDVTDKSSPRVISATTYPTANYTHQGALTEDKRYFLFGDELDETGEGVNTTTYILDVQDLDNPPTPKAFTHATKAIDHNMYVHGNRAFQSNYVEGLRILEFDNASLAAGQLNEVGFFDVVPGVDIAEYAGTWSNYRFPGSGTTVVSAIENQASGMFILTPTLPASEQPPADEEPPAEDDKPGKGGGKPDKGDKPGKGGKGGGKPDRT
jgi:choice-of-anchor B domain-containing protein